MKVEIISLFVLYANSHTVRCKQIQPPAVTEIVPARINSGLSWLGEDASECLNPGHPQPKQNFWYRE
jgi:hypothetical protein